MRRLVVPLFVGVVGFACGWVSRPRPVPPPPFDLTRPVAVYRGHPPATVVRPYHVMIDGRSLVVGDPPANAPEGTWVVALDGGRIRLACAE